jgi:hypothetical protein
MSSHFQLYMISLDLLHSSNLEMPQEPAQTHRRVPMGLAALSRGSAAIALRFAERVTVRAIVMPLQSAESTRLKVIRTAL